MNLQWVREAATADERVGHFPHYVCARTSSALFRSCSEAKRSLTRHSQGGQTWQMKRVLQFGKRLYKRMEVCRSPALTPLLVESPERKEAFVPQREKSLGLARWQPGV